MEQQQPFQTYEIPIRPKPKNNSRPIFTNRKTGKPFLGKQASVLAYEKEAVMVLRASKNLHKRPTLSGRLELRVWFEFMGRCPSDGDNLLKLCQDLLQAAGIISNDGHIKRVFLEIIEDAPKDRTLVQIGSLQEKQPS